MEAKPAARVMTMWQKVNAYLLLKCPRDWQTGIVPVRGVLALQCLNPKMDPSFCNVIWQHLL